jgi:hypothetical protein
MKRARLGVWLRVIGWMLTGLARNRSRTGEGVDSLMYGFVAGLGLVWLGPSQPLLRREVSTVAKSKEARGPRGRMWWF